jgi:23S rRNA pseudouridine955/2504/2580 synthase
VAKSSVDAARFATVFQTHSALKEYLAIAAIQTSTETPSVLKKTGCINEKIQVKGQVKSAQTRYTMLARNEKVVLFRLALDTGRMHQIRKHLASQGWPILGDDKYGDFSLNRKLRKEKQLTKLLLHASHLTIPSLGLDITCPLPSYWTPFIPPLEYMPS